jgi:hypothetical protein
MVMETNDKPFYLQLRLNRRFGGFELWYSSTGEAHAFVRLFKITNDQAHEMHADGWPIVEVV